MPARERQAQIMTLVRAHGLVQVVQLARKLNVSTMTIRRDLAALADQGLIERISGGGALRRRLPGTGLEEAGADQPTAVDGQSGTFPAHDAYVGLLLPTADYYFSTMIAGVRSVLDAHGSRRTLAISDYDLAREKALVHRLVEGGCTGLVLAPSLTLGHDDPSESA